jgi:hypothetical protein
MAPAPLPPLALTGGDAGPSSARSDFMGGASPFDSSNWTVSTGSSSAGISPLVLVGAGVLVLLIVWLTKKS